MLTNAGDVVAGESNGEEGDGELSAGISGLLPGAGLSDTAGLLDGTGAGVSPVVILSSNPA